MKKISLSILILLFSIFSLAFSSCVLAAPLVEDLTAEMAINSFFKKPGLDRIEGLWGWNGRYGTLEVAIVKNSFSDKQFKDFEYIGIGTIDFGCLPKGYPKLLLNKCSPQGDTYTGYFLNYGKNTRPNEDEIPSSKNKDEVKVIGKIPLDLFLFDSRRFEFTLPDYFYGIPEQIVGMKTYPVNAEQDGDNVQTVGFGTGFFIAQNILVTNYHVVAEANNILIHLKQNKFPGRIIARDEVNDLALVQVDFGSLMFTNFIKPLQVGNVKETQDGQTIFTIGYPMPVEMGFNAKVSEGIINSTTGMNDDPRMYQISTPIQPGNSGSPLFNDKGALIGVVTSMANNKYFMLKHGTIPQNVNYAIKINYINNLIMTTDNCPDLELSSNNKPCNAQEIMSSWKESVVLVESE